jgi:hypothetical protein
MSFNILQPRDDSNAIFKPQELYLSSESSIFENGNIVLGGDGAISQFHLLEPTPNNSLSSNFRAASDCLKAQMLIYLPGLPIWNYSNFLTGMLNSVYFSFMFNVESVEMVSPFSQFFFYLSSSTSYLLEP